MTLCKNCIHAHIGKKICDELNKRIDEAENMEDIKSILHIMVELEAISIRACLRGAIRIDKLFTGGGL